jgi:hypothetical protein
MRLAVIVLALSLGGCASTISAIEKLESKQVTPSAVLIAGNAFDAAVPIAEAWIRLPRCTGSNGPACRSTSAAKVIKAVRQGRVARANLEQFFADHPGQLGPQGLYDAFQAAIATLNNEVTLARSQ